MIVGSILVAMCLLVLGWTSEIVSTFVKDAEKVMQSSVFEETTKSALYFVAGLARWLTGPL